MPKTAIRARCPECRHPGKVMPQDLGKIAACKRCARAFRISSHVLIPCPSCQAELRVRPELVGCRVSCRQCRHKFVPTPAGDVLIAPTSPWARRGAGEQPPAELVREDGDIRGYLGLLQGKAAASSTSRPRSAVSGTGSATGSRHCSPWPTGRGIRRGGSRPPRARPSRGQEFAPPRDRASSAEAPRQELAAMRGEAAASRDELAAVLEQVAHFREELPRLGAESRASSVAADLMRRQKELLRDQVGEAAVRSVSGTPLVARPKWTWRSSPGARPRPG